MFADFIKERGETRGAWARRLGISQGYMSMLLNGQKSPSLDLALRIERETSGAVPVAHWGSARARPAASTPPDGEAA